MLRVLRCERPASLAASVGCLYARPVGVYDDAHAGAGALTVAVAIGADDLPDAVTDGGRWAHILHAISADMLAAGPMNLRLCRSFGGDVP